MVHIVNPFGGQKWNIDDKGNTRIKRSLTDTFKVVIGIAAVLTVLVISVIIVCFVLPKDEQIENQSWLPMYDSNSRLGTFEKAAVSTDAAPCAVIGKDILYNNGSAVDAAIAVLLCMGVVNPQSMGLGGGFLMLYYNREKDTTEYIDAREVAPIKATDGMFEGNATKAKLGGLSIAVPGELAGYVSAHDNFGSLPWEQLFPPTIKMCEEGITVNEHLARSLHKYREEILSREHMRNVFASNETGDVYKVGDVYKRLDLAETLRVIAAEKHTALYGQSDISTKFLKDLKAAGSIITSKDMESYIPEIREPITIKLRNNMTLYSVSLPGSGPILALILNVLDGFDDFFPNVTTTKEGTVKALHRMVETFKFAYAKRMDLEDDDSEEMRNLIKQLSDRDYADEIRRKIDDIQTHDPDYYGVNITVKEDHGTAHLSIIAPNGDAVSVTSTINQYFGSHVMSPSTGILLNDEMDDFSSPNITNYFGLPPTGKNHIRPRKRPFSSMCPSIVVDGYRNVRLAVGGNGGTQITTSVAQVIIRNMWLGNNIKEAIDAPRFHHQLLPNYIEHEERYPENILNDLKGKGHELHKLGANMLGIIMAVERTDNGTLLANSDYRKGGDVDGF